MISNSYQLSDVVMEITKPYRKQKTMGPIFRSSIIRRIEENRILWEKNNNGDIIGFLSWKRYKREPYLLLEKMAVRNPGQSVGTKLLNRLTDIAIEENRNIRLRVAKINDKGIKFYENHGFKFANEETHATYTMEKVMFQ